MLSYMSQNYGAKSISSKVCAAPKSLFSCSFLNYDVSFNSRITGSIGLLQAYGMMKDFPSCFSENGVQVADSPPPTTARAQNHVACIYHYNSQSFSGFITITWIKNLMAQAVSIAVENSASDSLGKVDIRPWLFSKRKGFKKMVVDSTKVDIYWDLSSAKFGSSPEPLEGFYLAIALNQELCLLVGDLQTEAYKKIDPSPFEKSTFLGRDYRKVVLQVTHLQWKFRGNQTIFVDGVCVEVYWDVHGWLFDSVACSAVFLFRTQAKAAPLEGSEDWQRLKESSHSHGFSLVLCAWKSE
ncbi:hypothetical protein AAHA92_24202 [Salvia divinorum]|uniref:Uncharacterized protein n=1 Tax=Salvia divinorum TaxID=28513 RepID=A0ABD1G6L8_SALDI